MPETSEKHAVDKTAIDEATAQFFSAFTNGGGVATDVDCLFELFIPQAIIVKNTGDAPEVYDVAGFIEPRRALLNGGSLVDFSEWETSEKTEIFGNIAHRFSTYQKSWSASGKVVTGAGAKTMQFVRTATGWRIAALAWDDETPTA